MNGKFIVYAVIVTMLSTGVSWSRFLSAAISSGSSSSSSGSSWSSSTGSSGGSWGSGSSGHK